MICDSPLYASVGVGAKYPIIGKTLFRNCKALFADADLVIGNFETVVYDPKDKSLQEIQMCCGETVVQDLKKSGFSVLNLANNHCMQHGVEGFQKTKDACEKYGIKPIGIKNEEPYIVQINGFELAFLSLCIHLEWYEPERILYENRIERIITELSELHRKDPNIVLIVSAHWGDEFAAHPSNAQIALAHKLVDCGADVILGHHAHVYQGIEEYNGSIIVYGQGNFISDMVPEMCRQTGVAVIEIDRQKKIRYELYSFLIHDDFVPAAASGEWMGERQTVLEHALAGEYTDEDYWKMITRNHSRAHKDFKAFFKRNISKYKLSISVRMIWEFIGRKIKRILGTSSDGKISSMDPAIRDVLKKTS